MRQGRFRSSAASRSERGAAIPEFSLVLPLFLFLGAVIVDLGMALSEWHMLHNISQMSLRLAVNFPQLAKGSVTNAAAGSGSHWDLQEKIHKAIGPYKSRLSGVVSVTTSRETVVEAIEKDDGMGGTTIENVSQDIVIVRLTMEREVLWSGLIGSVSFPLVASSEGSYLLQ